MRGVARSGAAKCARAVGNWQRSERVVCVCACVAVKAVRVCVCAQRVCFFMQGYTCWLYDVTDDAVDMRYDRLRCVWHHQHQVEREKYLPMSRACAQPRTMLSPSVWSNLGCVRFDRLFFYND